MNAGSVWIYLASPVVLIDTGCKCVIAHVMLLFQAVETASQS